MPLSEASPTADYAAAVEALALRLLDALNRSAVSGTVADHVRDAADAKAALAAVRVLGPDVFAPALLCSTAPGEGDLEVVDEALVVFPWVPGQQSEAACLAQATAALLARHGGRTTGMTSCGAEDAVHGFVAEGLPWRPWSQRMARLSPLALPGVHPAVTTVACERSLDLARGMTRALLRRDYPTAARLARWVALAHSHSAAVDVNVSGVVRHLSLCGAVGARMTLDLAIIRHVIARSAAVGEDMP
ncbi:hypothetical protein GCM10010234_41020 [Streptomyces hawaiiensis]|uniref:hypothetical protein n=1 Tax=Streptomyces hawaiiensis TaxID=67305 RepID=UPI0031DE4FBC